MTNPRDTCANPTCVEFAAERIAADGTNRALNACGFHLDWAKRHLLEDHPGQTITRDYIPTAVSYPTVEGGPHVLVMDDDADGPW